MEFSAYPTARRKPRNTLALLATTALIAAPAASFAQEQITLDEVVITASGHAQSLPDAPATVTIIDGDEIASKPYATVVDALKNVPGVVVGGTSTRSGAASISMRGMGQDYVLMLVDGKPLGNSGEASYNGYGSGQITTYLPPPSAIERIEVIRGPMSSLYGTAASGGVINIITKPVADEWSGSLTLGTTLHQHSEDGNSHEGRFYISGPLIADRLGLSLYGSVHGLDGRILDTGRDGVQTQDVTRRSLGARLDWRLTEGQDLRFEASTNTSDTTSFTEDGGTGGIEADRKSYGLTHSLNWGDGFETTSFLTYEDVGFDNAGMTSAYNQLTLNSRTGFVWGRHNLTAGFEYRDEETRHNTSRVPEDVDPNMTRSQWAVFAEDNIQVTDDFMLTLGLRYDDNERYGSHITPRVYGVWHATPELTVKGGVSGGYKTPQLKQADSNIYEPAGRGAGWDQGNTNLKPEESTNYEIGLAWQGPSGLQLGATAYHTRFTNKIDRDRVCSVADDIPPGVADCRGRDWVQQYVNRDRAELNGVELTADYTLGDVDLSFNYTYADSKITAGTNVGERFNSLPLHVANLGVDWQASDAVSLWGDMQYRSTTRDPNADVIGDHVIVDAGVDYQFNERVTGALAVYNLTDKRFDTNYGDGRRLYLGLTSTF